jgi:isopenicillin N synthase-like dioxygenase
MLHLFPFFLCRSQQVHSVHSASGSTALTTGMDSIAEDLERQGGYALVSLTEEQQEVVATGFRTLRLALEKVQATSTVPCKCISPIDDSAHATGYHPAASSNSMSRYNAHREGFVFSDGAVFGFPSEQTQDFEPAMIEMQACLHGIANEALASIARVLNLPEHWFQETFHHHEDHSQWHLKRYVMDAPRDPRDTISVCNNPDEEETVLLPQHTDPSLLSVVVLDQPGRQPNSMGLQLYQKVPGLDQRAWVELPFSGHAVAIILVGSVLSYITGGKCQSAKHRVIHVDGVQERMAATFFLRPKGSAVLVVPPSRALEGVSLKKQITFDAWSGRVSRNYMKQRSGKNGKATATSH